jgi:hypothetical protein
MPLSTLRRSPMPRRLRFGPCRAARPRRHRRLLVLTPLCLRKDLEEHDHDDTGPECPTERVEQVAHKTKRLRRHRRSDRVSTDIRGHAHDEAEPEDPVDGSLPDRGPPHSGRCSPTQVSNSRRSSSPRPDNTSSPGARSSSLSVSEASFAPDPSVMVGLPRQPVRILGMFRCTT